MVRCLVTRAWVSGTGIALIVMQAMAIAGWTGFLGCLLRDV